MANVSWSFYRSRRRIDIQRLVQSGRIMDYPTFVAYCTSANVIPASQQEFNLEFEQVLKELTDHGDAEQVPVPLTPLTTDSSNSDDGLEATVWLADVDEHQKYPVSVPPPRLKKKKSKDSNDGSET